jgi:pantothenate synthetase
MKREEEIQRIEKRLQTIEKELEKVRNYSAQIDGWQTQRFSKKSRKYDYLAIEKFELLKQLEELKSEL